MAIYRLPAGTTLILLTATYETEGPEGMFFSGQSFEELIEAAHGLLFDESDYGNVQNLDEKPEYDPDSPTTYEGAVELQKVW